MQLWLHFADKIENQRLVLTDMLLHDISRIQVESNHQPPIHSSMGLIPIWAYGSITGYKTISKTTNNKFILWFVKPSLFVHQHKWHEYKKELPWMTGCRTLEKKNTCAEYHCWYNFENFFPTAHDSWKPLLSKFAHPERTVLFEFTDLETDKFGGCSLQNISGRLYKFIYITINHNPTTGPVFILSKFFVRNLHC